TGGTADRNRSHWSTSKTPSYTKSVSWQHHPLWEARNSNASSDFGPFLQSPSGQPSAPVFLYLWVKWQKQRARRGLRCSRLSLAG
ncbi:hypothetical protein, partial [Shigella sonnei]|uniref:hypothetical protein n=1 Tax=Shigella sonnei TaxID=624 RepID=UPI0020901A8F